MNGFYRDECVSVTNTRERDEERERERERRVEREELFLQRRREIRTLGEIDVVCFFMCNGKRRGRKLTRSLVYSIFLISFHLVLSKSCDMDHTRTKTPPFLVGFSSFIVRKKKGREFSHLTPEQKHLHTTRTHTPFLLLIQRHVFPPPPPPPPLYRETRLLL